ncbi:MAG: Uma2 family endonuclease [Thermoanaerobaculia bacterium]
MATQASTTELVAALSRISGKAEIVGGEIVVMSPTGDLPSRAAASIYRSLWDYERRTRSGRAYTDNVGFLVDLPGRKSFSPDACFHIGPPTGPRFLQGAPIFAAEVRSEDDYGPAAQKTMAAKRADYFAAGTRVVWDVDVLREGVIRVYRATEPESPTVYGRGDVAEAEPALPGWTFTVDDIFE